MCNGCAALLAYVDQLEAQLADVKACESYWRQEAVEHALEVMRRDGEVRRLPDGCWERVEAAPNA